MISELGLHYLYQAATLGSMRAASARLGVAVSSISRQIAQLEAELGISLIERGGRTIRLTKAGRLAYRHQKDQVATREALYESIQQLREVKAGHVELAVGEGFLCRAFMRLIEEFQRRYPGVSVSIRTVATPDAARMVVADEAHMGVIFTLPNEPRLRTRVSVPQPLMAVCAPDHPAARLPGLSLKELSTHDLCLPPKSFHIRQLLSLAETRQHGRLQACLTTDSIHVMRAIVREGRAMTVLPHIAIVDDLRDGTLVALPLVDVEVEEARLALVHRVGRQLEGVPSRMLTTLQGRFRVLFEPDQPDGAVQAALIKSIPPPPRLLTRGNGK